MTKTARSTPGMVRFHYGMPCAGLGPAWSAGGTGPALRGIGQHAYRLTATARQAFTNCQAYARLFVYISILVPVVSGTMSHFFVTTAPFPHYINAALVPCSPCSWKRTCLLTQLSEGLTPGPSTSVAGCGPSRHIPPGPVRGLSAPPTPHS